MLIRRGDIFYADLRPVCTGEGFRCFTGTVAHNRQDAAER